MPIKKADDNQGKTLEIPNLGARGCPLAKQDLSEFEHLVPDPWRPPSNPSAFSALDACVNISRGIGERRFLCQHGRHLGRGPGQGRGFQGPCGFDPAHVLRRERRGQTYSLRNIRQELCVKSSFDPAFFKAERVMALTASPFGSSAAYGSGRI